MSKYDHYLQRANAPIAAEHNEIINKGEELALSDLLSRSEINQLSNAGYLSSENGYRRLADGSVYVAAHIDMPEVSIEMIDWWFWWHAAEDVRYQLWYPDMHFSIKADFNGQYNNESMTYRERLHLSQHLVIEDIGVGREQILIDFMSPKEFGFNHGRIDPSLETIICARVGSPERKMWGTEMCHYVRRTATGVEMRSRFWIGTKLTRMKRSVLNGPIHWFVNQSLIKKSIIPQQLPAKMFYHCSQEYHNLAQILSELYHQEAST